MFAGRDRSGERVLGDCIYRGVETAKLVIFTCFSLDGTGMAFSLLPRTGSSRHHCILANWHLTLVDSACGNCVLKFSDGVLIYRTSVLVYSY